MTPEQWPLNPVQNEILFGFTPFTKVLNHQQINKMEIHLMNNGGWLFDD
jgi:hypothetical protein